MLQTHLIVDLLYGVTSSHTFQNWNFVYTFFSCKVA